MARENSPPLDNGSAFPEMEFETTEGGKILFPRDFGQKWNVFLVYRGHW